MGSWSLTGVFGLKSTRANKIAIPTKGSKHSSVKNIHIHLILIVIVTIDNLIVTLNHNTVTISNFYSRSDSSNPTMVSLSTSGKVLTNSTLKVSLFARSLLSLTISS